MNSKSYTFLICFLLSQMSFAQNSAIQKSGDILRFLPVAVATGSTFIYTKGENEKWYTGGLQLSQTMATSMGATYALKYIIKKPRPDGSDSLSWPSAHTSSAFSGAAFLQKRYGWKIGIPSYLVASYVGFTRIHSNKHDIWDVLGGAVIGISSAYLWTKPYKENNLAFSPAKLSDGYGISLRYTF